MRLFSTAVLFAFIGTITIASVANATPSTTTKKTSAIKPAVKIASTAATPTAPSTPAAPAINADGLNPTEQEFVDLVNKERTSRGLNALTVDPVLTQIARSHSEEMCKLDYFDHHSPTPGITTPMDRFLKQLKDDSLPQPAYLLVGENIYYCSVFNAQYNAEYGHESLMNSPGHRANILEPRFIKIGVGTYQDAKGEFWVTESFLCDTDPNTASTDASAATTTASNN